MKILTPLIIAAISTLWACEDTVPYPGEQGGECRIALQPCNDGLECRDSACRTIVEGDEPTKVSLLFDMERDSVTPDGEDVLLVTLLATHVDDAAPYEGEMLLHIDPPEAGVLRPALVSFDQGVGFTEYVACNRGRDRVCPDVIRLTAALRDTPLTPFAVSDNIRLTTARPMDTPPVEPEEQ
jgi:hypothetical protein